MDPRQMDALVVSSEALRDARQALSRVQRAAPSLPGRNPVPPRLDDRVATWNGAWTKTRKSTWATPVMDRFRSEVYPAAPVRVDFVLGAQSRLDGRDQEFV